MEEEELQSIMTECMADAKRISGKIKMLRQVQPIYATDEYCKWLKEIIVLRTQWKEAIDTYVLTYGEFCDGLEALPRHN
jgi:hypothetical protein